MSTFKEWPETPEGIEYYRRATEIGHAYNRNWHAQKIVPTPRSKVLAEKLNAILEMFSDEPTSPFNDWPEEKQQFWLEKAVVIIGVVMCADLLD